jgi:8-oxo-dGTP pyrophosphatase MutT (NUDIX family)
MADAALNMIATSKLPYAKAGVVLTGVKTEDIGKTDAKTYVVAPYTEGRFGNNRKYYVLAKGGIDAGEKILDAALRETSEETGIDLHKLLGDDAVAKLRNGEEVGGFESPHADYRGVKIKSFAPQALDFAYEGRERTPWRTVLFKIEVEGIEKLKQHLKNPANSNRYNDIADVDHSTKSLVHSHPMHQLGPSRYPSFSDQLEWLRSMNTPQGAWSGDKAGVKLVLEDASGQPIPTDWFANLERQFLAKYREEKGDKEKGIETVGDWQNFLKQLSPENRAIIYQAANKIKAQLIEMGILGGDTDIIKIDTKDAPLVFYQEGADIISTTDWLKSGIKNIGLRKDFATAFGGNTDEMEQSDAPPLQRIERSQFAMLGWAVSEQDIAKVAADLQANPCLTKGVIWGAPVGDYLNGRLAHDLTAIHSQLHATHRVPLSDVVNVKLENKVAAVPNRLIVMKSS